MNNQATKKLLIAGMILFLFGLLNGAAIPLFENSRMGLSAHLAGVQNGMVLLLFGSFWKYINLSAQSLHRCWLLSVYSMYAIWFALLLAAILGTSSATPIAGAGFSASAGKELLVNIFLYSGSGAILFASGWIILGLMRGRQEVE